NDFISNSFILNTCDSTNTYLKNISMKNSTAEGTIVVANSQSNGKGRQGRLFYSPENVGLYFSILLKPFKIDLITSFIATSVATAIDKLYNVNTQIKWVNDIYLNGKKICGILTEGQIEIESQSPSFLIIGIGINVNNISINKELSNIATSLFIETKKSINRLELLSEIINNISYYANKISKGDFISIYRKKMFLVNSKIKFTRNNKILIGKVLGVDDDCSLIIETDNNEIINLNSGEVHIISV
ncbi:MAG: biotin--[acetyl-CoA-carboxylase] ligase, partial [Clostridia bacterium]